MEREKKYEKYKLYIQYENKETDYNIKRNRIVMLCWCQTEWYKYV